MYSNREERISGRFIIIQEIIPGCASLAVPIHKVTNLTKEHKKNFKWKEPQHESFSKLKQNLVTFRLFSHYPNDHYPVILTTDTLKTSIDRTLQQNINGEMKNLYYHSQVTSLTQKRYDVIELEALAIWLCFQHMKPYALGRSISSILIK